jgi:hypothetical protein
MPRQPKRLTKSQTTKITSMLGIGGTRSMAADYARCHQATIRAWMRRDPEFANQVIQAELRSERSFLNVIHEAGKDPKQWRAAAWALERLYPERYARRASNTMTDEQVQQLIAEIAEAICNELPKKYRQRVFCRLADFETNYRSHIGTKHHVNGAKARRKPKRRNGGNRSRSIQRTTGRSGDRPDEVESAELVQGAPS